MIIEQNRGAAYQVRRYIVGALALTWIATPIPLTPTAPFVRKQENRWLLHIEGGPFDMYLSDKGCKIEGQAYKSAIETVEVQGIDVNLDSMTASLPSATVTLAPDMERLLDPMTDLGGLTATLSVWCYSLNERAQLIRPLAKGRITDLVVGLQGDSTVFQIVEDFRIDPEFPTTLVSTTETSPSIADSADGTPYMEVFGNAIAVPAKLLGPIDPAFPANPLLAICFHGLAPDPCPSNGFPQDQFPDVGSLVPNTVIGQRYGISKVLRDDLQKTYLNAGWGNFVGGGTVTPGTGGVVMGTAGGATSAMFWTAWNFEDTISLRWLLTFTDAAAVFRIFYGDTDGANRIRIDLDKANSTITVNTIINGVVQPNPLVQTAVTFPAGENIFSLAVSKGSLEVGKNDFKTQFGNVIGNATGRVGFGCTGGRVLMRQLNDPIQTYHPTANNDMNEGIYTLADAQNRPIIVQKLNGDINAPLFTDFYQAQGVKEAGGLFLSLFSQWGLDDSEIDGPMLDEAIRRLRRFGVGAYFDAQAPITKILRDRLGHQFMVLFAQLVGVVRVFAIDPLSEPERQFTVGQEADMLERIGGPRFVDPYSHFKANYRFNSMTAKWRKVKLNPDVVPSLRSILDRRGERHYPVIELPDVPDEATASAILLARASLTHNAFDVTYRQTISHVVNPLGRTVSITDPGIGFDQKSAVLTSMQPDGADYVIAGYRAFDVLSLG